MSFSFLTHTDCLLLEPEYTRALLRCLYNTHTMIHETGNLLTVLIVHTVTFFCCGIGSAALFLYFWTQIPKHYHSLQEAAADVTIRVRKAMFMCKAVGCLVLSGVVLAMIFRIGTVHRSGDPTRLVNYSYFAIGESVAFATMAMIMTMYYWYDSTSNAAILIVLSALWPVLFGVGALPTHSTQRVVLFSFALVVQVGVMVFNFFAARPSFSWYMKLHGLVPQGILLVAYVLYDVFWYIGYNNAPQKEGPHENRRWVGQLVFLLAAFVAHMVLPAYQLWFYEAPKDTAQELLHAQQLLQREESESAL